MRFLSSLFNFATAKKNEESGASRSQIQGQRVGEKRVNTADDFHFDFGLSKPKKRRLSFEQMESENDHNNVENDHNNVQNDGKSPETSSGRSTPPEQVESTISSISNNDLEAKLEDCLDQLNNLSISKNLNKFRHDRRIGEKAIASLVTGQTATEAYYRTNSRTFKDLDRINEEIRLRLKIDGVVFERRKILPEADDFPALPSTAIVLIGTIWGGGNLAEVFAEGFGAKITRKDLMTLKGLDWLNDEVINFYMNLICERSANNENAWPKVYAFNTFFLPNLENKGYASVRRWTRKVDVFSYNILIVPVHLGVHWCLAVVDLDNKAIDYYDSMYGNNNQALESLRNYIASEAKDKKQQILDMSGWKLTNRKDIPRQMNGSDCGMFACKFAEYASRRAAINFTQQHMPYFRQRMVHEICSKQLM